MKFVIIQTTHKNGETPDRGPQTSGTWKVSREAETKPLACEMEWFVLGKMDFPEGSTSCFTGLPELLWQTSLSVVGPAPRSGPPLPIDVGRACCSVRRKHPRPGSLQSLGGAWLFFRDGVTSGVYFHFSRDPCFHPRLNPQKGSGFCFRDSGPDIISWVAVPIL